nr:hypothetical protein [Tanacetum cinerariifolium]
MDQTGVVVVTTTAAATTTTLAVTTGSIFKSIQSSSIHEHDPNTTVLSSPGVPLRATLTQYALLVDTKESVVKLQVLASSVVKLAIYRRTARRTPLQAH